MLPKNNLIIKLTDRLFNVLNEKSGIESIHIVIQIAYLLLLKRENPNLWKQIKQQGHSPAIDEIREQIVHIQQQTADSYNLPRYIIQDFEFKINRIEIVSECVDIINSIYKETENLGSSLNGTITYYDIDSAIFDDLYEKIMKKPEKFQNLYIPRHIRYLMASLTQINYSDRIYDPMCGNGGLLLSVYERIMIKEYESQNQDVIDTDNDGFSTLRYSLMANLPSPDTLNGSDPNPQQLLLSALSFQLRGIKKANLQPNNFIQDNISEHFDVIIANPPFGQKFNKPHQINEVVIKNAEIVFIDKIADTLSPTGRATIIVSEGFLSNTNSQHMQCRKKLFTQYRLEGVISLPSGIFLNAQAKSSILILSKDEHNNRPDVWFYELQNDGYTNDRAKRRTKEFPLPEVVKAFRERLYNSQNKRTETCFFVSFEEIQRNDYNLSYSRYKQFNYERQDHGDVCEMMQEIIHNERDIQNILNELESTFIWKK